MVNNEPRVGKTSRYTIDETCSLLGINRHTLRRYTKAGKIRCGYWLSTSRKFYYGSEILRFWKAYL
jgi:predicted site-specific integrase-resolvase